MAGIKEAMERVVSHRNEGKCVATGIVRECVGDDGFSECSNTPYIIVRLNGYKETRGLITVYDYGHDIRIAENIKVLDQVILMIQDNWTAKWFKMEDISKPHLAKTYWYNRKND